MFPKSPKFLLLPLLISQTLCASYPYLVQFRHEDESSPLAVVDLNLAADQIFDSLKNDVLLVEPVLSDGIAFLLKNFSVADLALEAEVLSHDKPALILFYNDPADRELIFELAERAVAHFAHEIVAVVIDAQSLFKLAQKALIQEFPCAVVLKDRLEKARLEGIILEHDLFSIIHAVLTEPETGSYDDEAEIDIY